MDPLVAYQAARRDEGIARLRRLLALRAMAATGMRQREIADALGKSVPAVHGLIHRGLRELRARLGDAEEYFSDARSSDTAGRQ